MRSLGCFSAGAEVFLWPLLKTSGGQQGLALLRPNCQTGPCVCVCVRVVGGGRLLWLTASPPTVCYCLSSNSFPLYEYTVVCLSINRLDCKKVQYTGNTSVKLGGVYLYHKGILQSLKSRHRDLLSRNGYLKYWSDYKKSACLAFKLKIVSVY